MTVIDFQKLLGKLYREDYKYDPVIAKNFIELGWATKRLLEQRKISPFDDYEKVQSQIYNEVEWHKTWLS